MRMPVGARAVRLQADHDADGEVALTCERANGGRDGAGGDPRELIRPWGQSPCSLPRSRTLTPCCGPLGAWPGGDTAIAPRRGRQFNVVARAPLWHARVRAIFGWYSQYIACLQKGLQTSVNVVDFSEVATEKRGESGSLTTASRLRGARRGSSVRSLDRARLNFLSCCRRETRGLTSRRQFSEVITLLVRRESRWRRRHLLPTGLRPRRKRGIGA